MTNAAQVTIARAGTGIGAVQQATAQARLPRAEVHAFDVRFAVGAALAEILVIGLAVATSLPGSAAMLMHFAIIGALAAALYHRRRSGSDLSAPLFTLIATSTSGPVGAVIGLLALIWLARPAQPSTLLEAWYNRIAMTARVDHQTQLSDRVASGRVIDTAAPPPDALAGVIRSGTLGERQAALGLIARFFHVNYLAALSHALKSEVPVIRVQAAAVASRIRPRLANEVTRQISAAGDLLAGAGRSPPGASPGQLTQRLELIRWFDQATASGLLDKPLQDAAGRMSESLASSIDCRRIPLPRIEKLEDKALLHAFERRLLAQRDYSGLRMLRRRRDLARKGFMRVRVLPIRLSRQAVGALAPGQAT